MTALHTTFYAPAANSINATYFVGEVARLVTLFNESQDDFTREDALFQLFLLLQNCGLPFLKAFPSLRAVAFRKAIQTLKLYGESNPLLLSVVLDFLRSMDDSDSDIDLPRAQQERVHS